MASASTDIILTDVVVQSSGDRPLCHFDLVSPPPVLDLVQSYRGQETGCLHDSLEPMELHLSGSSSSDLGPSTCVPTPAAKYSTGLYLLLPPILKPSCGAVNFCGGAHLCCPSVLSSSGARALHNWECSCAFTHGFSHMSAHPVIHPPCSGGLLTGSPQFIPPLYKTC